MRSYQKLLKKKVESLEKDLERANLLIQICQQVGS